MKNGREKWQLIMEQYFSRKGFDAHLLGRQVGGERQPHARIRNAYRINSARRRD
jgi:hypothetical protein